MSRATIKHLQRELYLIRQERAAGRMRSGTYAAERADLLWRLRGGGA